MKNFVIFVLLVIFVKVLLSFYEDKQESVKIKAENRLERMEKIVNEN